MNRGAGKGSLLFEARVDERGMIAVPQSIIEELAGRRKATFVVQLTERRFARELDRRSIGEEEIARITRAQLEGREPVIRFLLSEGALSRRRTRRGRTRGGKH